MSGERGFAEFAESTWRELRRTAYLMCGDWERAEDAAQDALVKVFASWRRVRVPPVRAYAHKVVASAVLDQGGRPWRRERATDVLPEVAAADHTLDLDRKDALLRALARLGPGQRACVVLRFQADLTEAETARALGISLGTVKSQTSRGLAALRALLEPTPERDDV